MRVPSRSKKAADLSGASPRWRTPVPVPVLVLVLVLFEFVMFIWFP